jgi:hypothetical protein
MFLAIDRFNKIAGTTGFVLGVHGDSLAMEMIPDVSGMRYSARLEFGMQA